MKHYDNTQPDLIMYYIFHSIPPLPCIHTRAHTLTHIHTISQPLASPLSPSLSPPPSPPPPPTTTNQQGHTWPQLHSIAASFSSLPEAVHRPTIEIGITTQNDKNNSSTQYSVTDTCAANITSDTHRQSLKLMSTTIIICLLFILYVA